MKSVLKNISKISLILVIGIAMLGESNTTYADTYYKKSKVVNVGELRNSEKEVTTTLNTRNNDEIYNKIYQAIINLEDSIDLSKYFTFSTGDDAANIYAQVLEENPQIFYMTNQIRYSGNDTILKLEFSYAYPKANILSMKSTLDNKIQYILNNVINSNMSDLEKELAIHDYLVLNTEYDQRSNIPIDSHNVYGTLIENVAVCDGYSKAFQLFLNKIGIECIRVDSEEMNHVWNMVTIDNEKYHVDVTWDDPIVNEIDIKDTVSYNYFNITDSQIEKDHTWIRSNYDACNSTKYSYINGMDYVEDTTKIDIQSIKGKDRYETAGLIADKQTYNKVILVNSTNSLADGLSASGLSGAVNAPILLTQKDSIPSETYKRINGVTKVYIIGSTNVISTKVEKELQSKGIEVKRLGGADRFETSYIVAKEISSIKTIDKVFFANGYKGEADAMSISPVANKQGNPIILTNGNNTTFKPSNTKNYVIGSTSVMSQNLLNETNSTRLGGIDRFETNKKVIQYFYDDIDEVYLAKGYQLVDSLTASPLAKDKPMVLVQNNSDKSILKGASKFIEIGGIDKTVLQQCVSAAK
ncbi:hypothetical protein CHF27_008830 [Romboutsia maritimum]|uniref:Transglutaminase-like domain-containing protein n=1 Tax=Romboutsia maritimum TaxID=2020948 RepID=A0A371IS87_9FIRM|nr:cell wall-binding repeat-containing protein [Romboutsia maritimum]RDY23341.1 hypothetical protein CHF27_008830 [Romboutsia maritimum]